GILRDGQSVRVSMTMRDSRDAWRNDMHRKFVAEDKAARELASHRPGFRDSRTTVQLDALEQAYRDADKADSERYKGETGTPTPEQHDAMPTQDAREREYSLYDREMSERWRS